MINMTQEELLVAIDCQKQIVLDRPHDPDEKLVLSALREALRKTFSLVSNSAPTSPQYVYSPSRAVLKRI